MRKHRDNGHGNAFGLGASGAVMMVILIGFLDLTSTTQLIGLAAAAIATPFVNPPPKNNGDKRLKVTPVPLFERLNWGSKLPHDLDIWTRCYSIVDGRKADHVTIGYNHRSDGWLDLLRDDQGGLIVNEEQLQSNSEVSAIPPNTLCNFNVHLYHSHGGQLPVEGELIVIQNKDGDDEMLVGDVKFTLSAPGEEQTVLTAAWDAHSNLIKGSVLRYPDAPLQPIATGKEN